MTSMRQDRLPVVVIGAGPVGLAAAAHLVTRGERPLVFEAGAAVGESVRAWAHVRLFSPWRYLIDPVVRQLLEPTGWQAPDAAELPTGGELVDRLLAPLAALPALAPHIRLGHRVETVTRRGLDKVKTAGRAEAPFELTVRGPAGLSRVLARAVIDASGTWTDPNPLGAGGVPVPGETEQADGIHYGIPDVLGRARARYAGRRTLVVGSGHSAFNAVLDLAALADQAPGTDIVWAVRRTEAGLMFGGGAKDALAARGALGHRLRALVDEGRVRFVTGFRADQIVAEGDRLAVVGADGVRLAELDQIVVAAGFRPDLGLTRELRLKVDPWLEAPERLAPLIDPNLHSCGTVYPHGAAELAHPETDFYTVGMKSYGRAPTFLLLTGYEQVRSVVCALTGDAEGAARVELELPETGVCQTDLGPSPEATGSACCGWVAPDPAAPPAKENAACCDATLVPAGAAGASECGCRDAAVAPSGTACCG